MRTRTRASQPGERDTALLAARIARHWARRRPRRGLLALLGPGLITGASDDDPSGIATYSQAGAQFGYSMVWVMLFTWPLMAAIQEISARIGRVTGHGIAGNIHRHYSPWLLRGIVVLLLVANVINLGADLGAMGEALRLLIGGPPHLYVVAFSVGCALLEIFVRYERYVSILKWTSVSLFAYVATARWSTCPGLGSPTTSSCRPSAGTRITLSRSSPCSARRSRPIASFGNPRRRRRTSASIPPRG